MKENFGITVIAILCGLLITVLVVGITFVIDKNIMNPEEYTPKLENRFVKIQDWGDNFVMYDKETRVQYFAFADYNYGGGITVLVDAEGKPLLYEGE